ncbi:hypothetical protein SR39_26255 [Methylobacterium radiotolerans]|nr:hypothetical protein SR39_26255 [Methylobacterium radiotolerans]
MIGRPPDGCRRSNSATNSSLTRSKARRAGVRTRVSGWDIVHASSQTPSTGLPSRMREPTAKRTDSGSS